ncbi:hypothetical protein HMPREF0645_2189 [Hallella bergensis DSM 17361]|uniref:Uncharacterized protein n=1 Tax=Hallella bergensis DSM 17361 TaxID=585502 RepID=D1PZ04_9BACT|nr:hypothetical protein HMPREF0645_2189 [Hallella bergensis DSM 17361]
MILYFLELLLHKSIWEDNKLLFKELRFSRISISAFSFHKGKMFKTG